MKITNQIEGKSLLIGGVLASVIFFATGATGINDKWDKNQRWEVISVSQQELELFESAKGRGLGVGFDATGWEPFGVQGANIIFRKRVDNAIAGNANNNPATPQSSENRPKTATKNDLSKLSVVELEKMLPEGKWRNAYFGLKKLDNERERPFEHNYDDNKKMENIRRYEKELLNPTSVFPKAYSRLMIIRFKNALENK